MIRFLFVLWIACVVGLGVEWIGYILGCPWEPTLSAALTAFVITFLLYPVRKDPHHG